MEHMTRFTVIGMMALALALAARPARAADFKIGIVDLQRVLGECAAGRKAREQFKADYDKAESSLKSEKDSLDRLKDELDKKNAVLSDDQRKSKMDDLARRGRDLQRKVEDSSQELQKKDRELSRGLIKDIVTVAQEVGEREGYTLILESSSGNVIYSAKSIDITDSVIKAFDAKR
jgi:outer membrane protein